MSKHNTPLHDIKTLSTDELTDRYGIEIDDDGFVWDSVEGQRFGNLLEWASYLVDEEESACSQHSVRVGHKQMFDDGY